VGLVLAPHAWAFVKQGIAALLPAPAVVCIEACVAHDSCPRGWIACGWTCYEYKCHKLVMCELCMRIVSPNELQVTGLRPGVRLCTTCAHMRWTRLCAECTAAALAGATRTDCAWLRGVGIVDSCRRTWRIVQIAPG
jgi:hypothetical protein